MVIIITILIIIMIITVTIIIIIHTRSIQAPLVLGAEVLWSLWSLSLPP